MSMMDWLRLGVMGWSLLGWVLVLLAVMGIAKLAVTGPAGLHLAWDRWVAQARRMARERRMLAEARDELREEAKVINRWTNLRVG